MSFLRKHFNISVNSISILRGFTTLTSKPFPDNPTATYYDNLAADVANSGDFDSLRDLLNKRIQDGLFNTKRTFSFITNTNFSPSFLNDVVTTLSHLNPGFTRRNAFDSLVTRLCKLRRVDDALHVIESMSRVGYCNLSPCTFYPILNLLTREKSLDHAQRVVESMARLGVSLDLMGHNFFLTAHCFIGDVNAAVGVLEKMEEEGFCPDARTYDALVLGACRKGKVDCAMVVVRRMVDDGVPMLYSTHMHVIEGLLKMNCFEEAIKYVRCFSGKDKALDCELLGCLGSKLVGLNRVKEAMFVLGEMEKMGLIMGYKLKNFYEMNLREEDDSKLLKEL